MIFLKSKYYLATVPIWHFFGISPPLQETTDFLTWPAGLFPEPSWPHLRRSLTRSHLSSSPSWYSPCCVLAPCFARDFPLPGRPFPTVSVCSGYDKVPQTRWLMNNRNRAHDSRGWKPKVRVPVWWSESPLPGHRLLCAFSHGRRGYRSHWSCFCKGVDPITEGSALMT